MRSNKASSLRYLSDVQTRTKFLNMNLLHLRFRKFGATWVRRSYGDIRWKSTTIMWERRIENRARKNQSFWIVVAWKSSY